MGMTIDEAKTVLFNMLGEKVICEPTEQNKAIAVAIKTIQNYQMMQADYNARLKADMVAMLEDLDLQIDESAAYNLEVAKVQRLIRDKIDKLKEDKE